MKQKILFILMGVLLFLPGMVNATAEDDLKVCLASVNTTCTVSDDLTLTDNLTIPSDKTVIITGDYTVTFGDYHLEIIGKFFMTENNTFATTGTGGYILGKSYNALYAIGTPGSCEAIITTDENQNECGNTPSAYIFIGDSFGEYVKVSRINATTTKITIVGEFTIYDDTIFNAGDIVEGNNGSALMLHGRTTNNGTIGVNVRIYDEFTNNKENGLTKEIYVDNGGTFINNKDITVNDLGVNSGGTITNNSDIIINSNGGSLDLEGTINNTGTIKYNQEVVSNEFHLCYNDNKINGNLPQITYIKSLDYSKRLYNNTTVSDGDEHKVVNGLLLYADLNGDLNYYNNILSSNKKEYNVVASFNQIYTDLELMFSENQQGKAMEYEILESINMDFDIHSNNKAVLTGYSDDYDDNGTTVYSKYFGIYPEDGTKPMYFKYKISGFTTGEEILIQGAMTLDNELSALFEANGGSYTYPVFETAQHLIIEPTAPTRDGYTFKGWYTEPELTNKFNFETAIDENIILYASWQSLTENPKTSDAGISIYLIISILSLLGIEYTKKYKKDYLRK